MTDFEVNLITGTGVLFMLSLTAKLCMAMLKIDFLHSGQNALTLFILPQAAFIVTTAVSGNLALSLGLVGALSIVRFRNPVRSSMELSVYFLTIGAGIAATVNVKLSILMGVVFVGLTILSLIAKKVIPDSIPFKTQLATVPQITEQYIVQVESSRSIDIELEQEKILSKLISKMDDSINYHYTVSGKDYQSALSLTNHLAELSGVVSANYNSSQTEPLEFS